jgi:hypothetical protein
VSPAIAAAVVIARLAAADAEEQVGQAEQHAAEQQHTGQVEAGVQGVGGRFGRGALLMPSVSWGRPGTADLPLRDLTRWPDASPPAPVRRPPSQSLHNSQHLSTAGGPSRWGGSR